MTTLDKPRNLAHAQNVAITTADDALQRADLPTFTETILALDALARATDADEIAKARNIAIYVVMSATGTKEAMPAFWIQLYGRAYRRRDPRDVAREVCPASQCEDIGLDRIRIRVPADQLETVRAAVERHRMAGIYVEYLPLETDK